MVSAECQNEPYRNRSAARPATGEDLRRYQVYQTESGVHPCPCCGGRMLIIETFERGCKPRHRPSPLPGIIRIDTS